MHLDSRSRLRVLTLNIRLGAGGGVLDKPAHDMPASEQRDAALAQAIHTVDPDIVGLQEVRSARQTREIADRLKLNSVYLPHPFSYSLNFFEWGLALLFRFKLIDSGNFAVSFDPDVRSGRNGIWANLEVGERTITVMNVHLEERNRSAQVDIMVKRAAQTTLPLIIMGDFNCEPDSAALAPLKHLMTDSCGDVDTAGSREVKAEGTLAGTQRRIDNIFVNPRRFDVLDAGLLPPQHRGVSDHIGYYTDILVID